MKPTLFTRVLAGVLSITMACLPLHGVAADVQRQSGLSGQQEGKILPVLCNFYSLGKPCYFKNKINRYKKTSYFNSSTPKPT
jgi:hypothetical protein